MGKIFNVMLIGAGEFGKNYIRILKKLENEGRILFKGVIVKTKESKAKIISEYGIDAFDSFDEGILKDVDAAIIAAPPATHYELAKKCLEYTNVLVEKPLAEDYAHAKELKDIADKSKRTLMAGHIFRFHPAVKKLREILTPFLKQVIGINGRFTNPISSDRQRGISLEMLHLYDILDYVLEKEPIMQIGLKRKRVEIVSLRYPGNVDANIEIGWRGIDKKRRLAFYLSDSKEILCNLIESEIRITDKGKEETISCIQGQEPLEMEICAFLDAIEGKTREYPDGNVGARIVKIASSVKILPRGKRPRVAIIGAGLFGANCAIHLDKRCDVVIFERKSDILQEASFINQYRHHWGYHYPRSVETVNDIKNAAKSFEDRYNESIIRNFPTFYCVVKEGSRVPADQYIKFCRDCRLPFKLEFPDPEYVNRDMISASLKTDEPIYDFPILHRLVKSYLSKCKNVELRLESEVVNASFEDDGTKNLVIKSKNRTYEERFDYVINVTYANLNKLMYWLGFPIKPLRIDLVEALIVKLPIPKISFAFMDGPFTNLVPTSENHTFTLVHIKYSMLRRDVPPDGLIPKEWYNYKSNRNQILEESEKWLPILKKAEVLESRYVFRGVNAYREHDDARPSDIIRHGFGCWSILGGKIINCVSASQELLREIFPEDWSLSPPMRPKDKF